MDGALLIPTTIQNGVIDLFSLQFPELLLAQIDTSATISFVYIRYPDSLRGGFDISPRLS